MDDVIVISSDTASEPDSSTEATNCIVFTPTKRPPSPDLDSEEDVDAVQEPVCRKRIKFETIDSESDSEHDTPTCDYLNGEKDFPIFSRVTAGYGCEQLIHLLMTSTVPESRICTSRPTCVSENATFIIDVDAVRFSDLKSDDMGTWKSTGTKSIHFRISKEGIRFAFGSSHGSSDHVLTRRYYVHGSYQLYKRIIVDIRDSSGARNKLALLQYMFEGPEIKVQVKPHGNAKSTSPYFRTSESTREQILKVAASHTPKAAVVSLTKEQGGEIEARSISCLPRNRQQISNIRRSKAQKDPNVLYSVMLECKRVQGRHGAFVRDVKAAPSPQGVLFFDWQLQDMVRFLTNNQRFGILTADTTFDLGEFYVTPTSYRHLMLEDIKSRKHPVVLGPVLVHQQKDFSSFNYFASTLVSHDRRVRNLLAFGTDGDKALVEAFAHNFPFALQLRCFLHLKRNIEEKLQSIGIPKQTKEVFIADVFGKQVGGVYKEGLVDCASEEAFDAALQQIENVWNTREQPYATSSGPQFYDFFCRYQADVVKFHMRRDIREAAGLGSPPSIFTTNPSESVNAELKRKVDYRESEWPVFNKHVEQLVESQRDEIIRALSGRGQYRLLPEFQHLVVPIQDWMKMRPDQRQKVIADFDAATLGGSKLSKPHEQLKEPSVENTSLELSISAEDSGISVIPLVTLDAMWSKASELLSADNAITAAPGSDKKARMVLSYSSEVPHLVRSRSGGQYMCDDNCLHWKSARICSHSLAVAEVNKELSAFLQWYSRAGLVPNITVVGMQGLPSGRGRKGGRPKRQRKRNALSEPLVTVSNPGIMNVSTDSTGPVSQSVSIHLPSSSTTLASKQTPPGPPPLISVSGPSNLPVTGATFVSPSSSVLPPVPPLVDSSRVQNVNPFYCKFLGGNIRVCRGCRGSLRTADSGIPSPPFDLVIARSERCTFRNPSGELITPRRETVCHYHCKVECIQAVEPGFVCSSLHIPLDVCQKLNSVHLQHLQQSFNIQLVPQQNQ